MSISEDFILVKQTIKKYPLRKRSDEATKAVNEKFGAEDAGNFNKRLFSGALIDELISWFSQARKYHYQQGEWDDTYRIVRAENVHAYMAHMAKCKYEIQRILNLIESDWDRVILESQLTTGGLWKKSDYPETPQTFTKRHVFKIKLKQIEDVDDIRVKISGEARERIEAQIRESQQRRFENLARDLWGRVFKNVSKVIENMGKRDKKDKSKMKPRFHMTMFTNLENQIDIMKSLEDALDDIELSQARMDIEKKILPFKPERPADLATDPEKSAKLLAEANKFMAKYEKKMSAYLPTKPKGK